MKYVKVIHFYVTITYVLYSSFKHYNTCHTLHIRKYLKLFIEFFALVNVLANPYSY